MRLELEYAGLLSNRHRRCTQVDLEHGSSIPVHWVCGVEIVRY